MKKLTQEQADQLADQLEKSGVDITETLRSESKQIQDAIASNLVDTTRLEQAVANRLAQDRTLKAEIGKIFEPEVVEALPAPTVVNETGVSKNIEPPTASEPTGTDESGAGNVTEGEGAATEELPDGVSGDASGGGIVGGAVEGAAAAGEETDESDDVRSTNDGERG